MSSFSSESSFSRQGSRQALCLFKGDNGVIPAPTSQTFHDEEVRIARQELDRWYTEMNDIVRSLGLSTNTGRHAGRDAQKRAQKASIGAGGQYGSLPLGEIHDRLTEIRDHIYRYMR